ncbi:MAG: nucleotidyltransferase domain-containing protein [archaeon]
MGMYKLKFTRLQNEIFRLLCIKAGSSLNQRIIAEMLKVSPTAVAKAIKPLEKNGLVTIEKSKRMNLNTVLLNREESKTLAFKRVENLKLIYESGLVDFLENRFPGSLVILFGSYSIGEDTIDSDIDIAVIGSKEKTTDLGRFEKLLERTIYLHQYASLRKINENLRGNIINGITLAGSVEL